MKQDIINSFNRIALLEDKWDHNQNYGKLLLKQITREMRNGLDIGCGTGEFTKSLSGKMKRVLGIDISPVMIEEAKKRHFQENIKYIVKDFDELDEDQKYDCIVSIATFHHLDLETALPKMRRLLNKDGLLLVLDLYERKGLVDLFLDLIAVPANFVIKRLKNGKRTDNLEEIEAWREHSKIDTYMTYRDLKKIYKKHLVSNVEIRRLLFWRYMVIYRKG
jgi:ubiquinone/menaquinone biosynthesis C-methylase UbiE